MSLTNLRGTCPHCGCRDELFAYDPPLKPGQTLLLCEYCYEAESDYWAYIEIDAELEELPPREPEASYL